MIFINSFIEKWINLIPFTNSYVKVLIFLVIFVLVMRFIVYLIEKYISSFVKDTKTNVDDIILKALNRPIFYILFFWGAKVAVSLISLNENINGFIQQILNALMILAGAVIFVRLVNIFIDFGVKRYAKRTKSDLDDELLPISHKVIRISVFILAIMWILHLYGVNIGPVLASLGIAGLAIGLALQPTLGNIFAGISIVSDRSIKRGDRIMLEGGEEGVIYDIGLRSTKIETFDKQVIIVPNSQLANGKVINYARPDIRSRIALDVGVAYGSDIEKVKKVLLSCVNVIDKEVIDKDKDSVVYFTKMGDFALTFKLIVYLNSYKDKFVNEVKLREKVYNELKKNNLEIPFPTQTVYVKK